MSCGSVTWTVMVPAESSSFGTRKVSWLNEPDCVESALTRTWAWAVWAARPTEHDGDGRREREPPCGNGRSPGSRGRVMTHTKAVLSDG